MFFAVLWTAEASASRYFCHLAAFAQQKYWTEDDEDCDGPTAASRGGPISIFAGEDPAEKTSILTRFGETAWHWVELPSLPAPTVSRLLAVFAHAPCDPVDLKGFPVQALAPPAA